MSGIVSAPLLAPRGQGQTTQSGRGRTGVHAETEVYAETEIFQTIEKRRYLGTVL